MKVLRWLDGVWLRVERVGVVVGLLVMALSVSADVLHRKLADPGWKTPGAIALVLLATTALSMAAIRAGARAKLSWIRLVLAALGVTLALALTAGGFVALTPDGLIWSQRLALILMLWVAFFGASIATHEKRHLKLEASDRIFTGKAGRYVGVAANGMAAVAVAVLAWLSGRYCAFLFAEYSTTDGAAGTFDELAIPQGLAYAVLPLSLAVMALRFTGHAVAALSAADDPQGANPDIHKKSEVKVIADIDAEPGEAGS